MAGTPVEMVQETDHPWKGAVAITVNPQAPGRFALRIRVPQRGTSALYHAEPAVGGLARLAVNGEVVTPRIEKGYAVITREWRAGDKIELELPMAVQRVTADDRIEATRGKVALRYGPLVYNVERADQARIDLPIGNAALVPEWRGDLLGGVVALRGRWADGSTLIAVPNFARMNRTGGPIHELPGRSGVEYAPGTTSTGGAPQVAAEARRSDHEPVSQVWLARDPMVSA